MAGAGDYNRRLEWLKRDKAQRVTDGFGQPVAPFPSQGYLWGAVEDLAGGRETTKDGERQQTSANIRLRGWPAVAAGDRLRDAGWGDVWVIRDAVPDRAKHETVCEVERWWEGVSKVT